MKNQGRKRTLTWDNMTIKKPFKLVVMLSYTQVQAILRQLEHQLNSKDKHKPDMEEVSIFTKWKKQQEQ